MATPAAQIPTLHFNVPSAVIEEILTQSPVTPSRAIIKDALDCGCIGTCTCGKKPNIADIVPPPGSSEEMIVDPFAVSFSMNDVPESIPNHTGKKIEADSLVEEDKAAPKDEPQQIASDKLDCGCVGICNCHEKPKLLEIVDPTNIEGESIVDAFASDPFAGDVVLEEPKQIDVENGIADKGNAPEIEKLKQELSQATTTSEEPLTIITQQEPTTSEIPVETKFLDPVDSLKLEQNPIDSAPKLENSELKSTEPLSNNPSDIGVDLKPNDTLNSVVEKIDNQTADNQNPTVQTAEKLPEVVDVSVNEQSVNITRDNALTHLVAGEAQISQTQPTEAQVTPPPSSEITIQSRGQSNPDAVKIETLSKFEPSSSVERTIQVTTQEYNSNSLEIKQTSNGALDKIHNQSSQVTSVDLSSTKASIVAEQAARVIEKLSNPVQSATAIPTFAPSSGAQIVSDQVNTAALTAVVSKLASQTPLSQLNEQLKITTYKIEKLITSTQPVESFTVKQVASQASQGTIHNNTQQILLRMLNAVSQNTKTDPNSTLNNQRISKPAEVIVQKDLRDNTNVSTEQFVKQIKTVDILLNQPEIQARVKELDFILTRVKALSENITQKEPQLTKGSIESLLATGKINQEIMLLKTQHAQLRALQAQLVQEFETLIKFHCHTLLESDEDFITMSEYNQLFEGRSYKKRRLTRQSQNPTDAKSIIKKNLEREAKRKKNGIDAQVPSQVTVTASKTSGVITSAAPKQGASRGPSASLQGSFHGESRNGFII